MPPTRIPGRKVVLAFLLLILTIAGSAVGIFLWGREPLGTIHAMAPVDDHRVFLVRDGHRQHGFKHLTLRDLRDGQVWAVPFNDIPSGSVPLAIGGRALIWVRNANSRNEVHAFDLETGRFGFRVAETPIVRGSRPTVELVAFQDRAVASIGGATPRVDLIDVREGRIVASHELPGERMRAPSLRVVAAGVEVLPADGVMRLLDVRSGTLATLPPMLRSATGAPNPAFVANDGTARIRRDGGFWLVSAKTEDGRVLRISLASLDQERIWVVSGKSVALLDASTGRVVASHGAARFEARRDTATP